MPALSTQVIATLRAQGLPKGAAVLVACSGGADSVAMLHLAVQAGLLVQAAHANFGLRGADSAADEALVAAHAAALGVPLHVAHFADTPKLTGESTQLWARRLRWEWMEELLQKYNLSAILTGHHADDEAETLLMRLFGSAGPQGMLGLQARKGNRVRPLLGVPKADIVAWLTEQGIAWREDASNAGNGYVRNRIRNIVVPALDAALPQWRTGLLATRDHLANVLAGGSTHTPPVPALPSLGQTLTLQLTQLQHLADPVNWLRQLFSYQISGKQAAEVLALLQAQSGAQITDLANTYTATRVADGLLVVHVSEQSYAYTIHAQDAATGFLQAPQLPFTLCRSAAPALPDALRALAKQGAYFLSEDIAFPLTLAPWQAGQRMRLASGAKKISDLLIDAKVPLPLKTSVYVLTDAAGLVLWISTGRVSQQALAVPGAEGWLLVWRVPTTMWLSQS